MLVLIAVCGRGFVFAEHLRHHIKAQLIEWLEDVERSEQECARARCRIEHRDLLNAVSDRQQQVRASSAEWHRLRRANIDTRRHRASRRLPVASTFDDQEQG